MTHNSIWIRIRKSELETLRATSSCKETVDFPNGTHLSFSLSFSTSVNAINASLSNHSIDILIPKSQGEKWMATDEVGMSTIVPLSKDETLNILIEKDFPCMDRPQEDKSDTFWELAPEQPESC